MTICMLADKEILPAKKGTVALNVSPAQSMLEKVGEPWRLNEDATKLHVSYKFKNFKRALHFVHEIGMIADAAMHHPDI
ncbi:MAG: pterin-4a-carbinolamine dehydratase, partial [bacterium]